jgi:hypothetical protein
LAGKAVVVTGDDRALERERRLEKQGGAVGLVVAVATMVDQIGADRGVGWTGVVLAFGIVGGVLLVVGLTRHTGRRAPRVAILAGGACVLASVGTVLLAPVRSGQSEANGAFGDRAAAPRDSPNLLFQLALPDQTRSCASASWVTASVRGPGLAAPGGRAYTYGTMLSVLMQSARSTKVVVTRIRTVVDRRGPAVEGRFTPPRSRCQGTLDSARFLADLTGTGDVVPDQSQKHAGALPMTVSSADPVGVYIAMPKVKGSVAWHIEVTWIVVGKRHVSVVPGSRRIVTTEH